MLRRAAAARPRWTALAYQALDVARPRFERGAALVDIAVTVVNGRDATNRAGHMVEDLVDDMRRDIEPSHPGRGRPPQVMQNPVIDRRPIRVFAGLGKLGAQ